MSTELLMGTDSSIKRQHVLVRAGNERARGAAQSPRRFGVDLRISAVRKATLLPWQCGPSSMGDELTLNEIVERAKGADGRQGVLLLGGGDLIRRGDLWELLAELIRLRSGNLGVCTSGYGVNTPVVERLRSIGVKRVCIPFHCGRQDAHDWLVGQPGALKMAHRAIRTCVDAGVLTTAEVVLTRPTAPYLAETIEVLARAGVQAVCVRRLMAGDTDGPGFVSLSPRLSLLEPSLEQAAAVALTRRVRLTLRDLPLCVAPRLRPLFAPADSEAWVMSDGTVRARAEAGVGCALCPGGRQCAGAPQDYVSRFGWEEFTDPWSSPVRMEEDVTAQTSAAVSSPMVFTWRGPQRVRCEACTDAADEKPTVPPSCEATRLVRFRLVQAARYRPSVLRLVGAELLAHPQSALLIYDALRLFPRVEVAGEASAVADWSELDLRHMKDLHRLDVALYGPDAATHDAHCGIPGAFAAMLRGIDRLGAETAVPIGAYAVLHDARLVAAFAEAWESGRLPGTPRFRLSARGGSLEELARCAGALPDGPTRQALAAVLPHCLLEQEGLAVRGNGEHAPSAVSDGAQRWIESGRSVPYHPCGSDPLGAFEACEDGAPSCAVSGCLGKAVGWQCTVRSRQWMASI